MACIVGVIHHGGAGTTVAALRAGVPSMAIPFAFDQSIYGDRLSSLQCGAVPIAANRVTVSSLVEAITYMQHHHATMTAAARRIASELAAEHGPTTAAEFVAKHL